MLRILRLCVFPMFLLGLTLPAQAAPAKIIILRHGEKQNPFALCQTGVDRSLALAAQYLGQGAKRSLFAAGETPAAFFAITLHTLELASPAAATWEMPVTTFSSVPLPGIDLTPQFNLRTQQAAGALLNDPRYHGKTVVMVWEHRHIADRELELKFPDQKVSLRQLFNLDKLKDVSGDLARPELRLFLDCRIRKSGDRCADELSVRCGRIHGRSSPRCPRTSGVSARDCSLGNKCLP